MNDPLHTIVFLIRAILNILTIAIVLQTAISWVRPNPDNSLVRLLNKVTNPIMRPLERVIPTFGGLDITPVVAIVLLQLVQMFLPRALGVY